MGSLFQAEYPAMCLWATRAVDGARPLSDRPLAAAASGLLAMAEACSGEIQEAEAHRATAREIVDALPDAQLAPRLAAAGYLATAELYLDRFAEAAAHAGRGLELARATGQMSPTLVPTLVTAWSMTGRLAEASQLLDGALESARASSIPQALAWTLVNRSIVETAAGGVDAALSCAKESQALPSSSTSASCRRGPRLPWPWRCCRPAIRDARPRYWSATPAARSSRRSPPAGAGWDSRRSCAAGWRWASGTRPGGRLSWPS